MWLFTKRIYKRSERYQKLDKYACLMIEGLQSQRDWLIHIKFKTHYRCLCIVICCKNFTKELKSLSPGLLNQPSSVPTSSTTIHVLQWAFFTLQQFLMQVQAPLNFINIEILFNLLQKYSNHSKLTTAFREINELCHLELKYSKPEGIIQTAKKINLRQASPSDAQKQPQHKEALNWAFGEFKIFIWVIIYQQLIHQAQLKEFTPDIIAEIQSIFTSKSIPFIRYEVKLLSSYKNSVPSNWFREELNIFQKIMNRYKDQEITNWKMISFALFTESDCKYFRNLNHCREKWNNHLNPHVNKGDWTVEEDIQLFQLVQEHGLKWSKISKSMASTRTEHMVKNRYNRYLRLWKANKNTPASYIRNIFKSKIERSYFKKQLNKKTACSVKTEVLMEEESEKSMESNDATIKASSYDQLGNQGQEENVKQQNQEQPYRRPENESQKLMKPNEENAQSRWSYYPFLNLYVPQALQTSHIYHYQPSQHYL